MKAWVRNTLTLVGGASLSMTLAACYGAPCVDGDYCGGPVGEVTEFCDTPMDDYDLDGHCGAFDCNENDESINSSADDPEGDDLDQNCDGADGVVAAEENAGGSDG